VLTLSQISANMAYVQLPFWVTRRTLYPLF